MILECQVELVLQLKYDIHIFGVKYSINSNCSEKLE